LLQFNYLGNISLIQEKVPCDTKHNEVNIMIRPKLNFVLSTVTRQTTKHFFYLIRTANGLELICGEPQLALALKQFEITPAKALSATV
jgi:hypothetical protein